MGNLVAEKFSSIQLLALDFDGVFTDNKVYTNENGEESVRCDRSDGLGIAMLKERLPDLYLCVISKEKNQVVRKRCEKLEIPVYHGIDAKLSLLEGIARERGVAMDTVAYVGNDLNDLDCIRVAGLGIAVADSVPEVLKTADYVTTHKGGDGAIREIIDMILHHHTDRKGST